MVSTPVQNFSNFLKNRPPLVIFLLCLVVLAVSTFYFAFEVESNDPIIDSDKKHDWVKLVKYLNTIDICISLAKWTEEIDEKKYAEAGPEEQIVHTSMQIEDSTYLESFNQINGYLTVEGWLPVSCQDNNKFPKNLTVLFNTSQLDKLNDSQNVCVTIKGPAQYLPYFKESPCEPVVHSQNVKGNVGYLSSKLRNNNDESFCDNGKIVKLIFDMKHTDIANYISDDVRTQIYIHLMWCSYSLVIVIFIILIYAIVKKSEYLEKKEINVRLL
ncbi:transmembrane protein 248-like [Rhynchophorus ferrugineus]|uniref:transmembrane protein 248-like n=1 Tax=Rhynchophorus ferrugineus TaxID=354439 RepID=UPI003FCCD520